jgi:hypothetical protein
MLAVAMCPVLLAGAGTTQPDPCWHGHLWAPAKPPMESAAALVSLSAATAAVTSVQLPRPERRIRPAPPTRCERGGADAAREPLAPRAPPAA